MAVGLHQEDSQNPGTSKGNDIPVTNVPTWGNSAPMGQSAILVHYTAAEITNPDDSPVTGGGTVSTYEELNQSLVIYPNPANDQFTLVFPEGIQGDCQVEVFDLAGKQVTQSITKGNPHKLAISSSSFSPGIYLVRVTNQERQWNKCIVIDR